MLCFLYIIGSAILLAAGYFWGDSLWWLALVNSFRYWLFAPLILFWIEQLWEGIDQGKGAALGVLTALWLFLYLWFPFYEKPGVVEHPLKVMTFNLLYKNQNLDSVANAISKSDPDIVALQEITETQGKVLKNKLSANYPYTSFSSPHNILGVATFSKWKIERSSQIPIQIGYSQLVTIKHKNKNFHLVNIHTESIEPLDVFGQGTRILKAYQRREELIFGILAYLKNASAPLEDTILLGDFNSTEGNKLYRIIQAAGFTDSYRAVNSIFPNSFTFPNNLLGLFNREMKTFPILRIDYIYTGSHFKPISGYIFSGNTGSDHKPVIMNLGIL
jgi:endonuclease/exonuclease/phosphatase family metal-dependent hydrolase